MGRGFCASLFTGVYISMAYFESRDQTGLLMVLVSCGSKGTGPMMWAGGVYVPINPYKLDLLN